MDKGTIIRTLVLSVALTNQLLMTLGLTPIPGDQEVWYEVISTMFTSVVAIWTWFKNNYVTVKGKKQKEILKQKGLIK